MIDQKKAKKILWYEAMGFLLLILLSWLNELIGLPNRLFGSGDHANIHEAILETTALVMVWILVTIFTKRLLKQLHHLESFLRVCAWCRKIGHEEDWTTLEEYFAKGYNIQTSHAMCPECQKKWEQDHATQAV